MKKFLALFLICVLVVSMLCVGVLAADTPSPEGQVEPPHTDTPEQSPQTGIGGSLMVVVCVVVAAMFVAVISLKKVSAIERSRRTFGGGSAPCPDFCVIHISSTQRPAMTVSS